jgi:hypothetical protein
MENKRMDSMDNFRERFEALEQQTNAMEAHTHTVERRLRRWRGMAGGLLVLGLLSWALPSGKAADTQPRGMAERMATMEKKLAAMDFDDAANEVVISGANLRIVNGLGSTETTNGLGNLIVGYNEPRPPDVRPTIHPGSHNIVVGSNHNFSSFGGLVAGILNEISGQYASVSGGVRNTASGFIATVSGGVGNTASGQYALVSGGFGNTASAFITTVSGGGPGNTASGDRSSVYGGQGNMASGDAATVSGGLNNTASGAFSSVSGGNGNIASGNESSVSGGNGNLASDGGSSVSGGHNRRAPGKFNWAAGALFSDQ